MEFRIKESVMERLIKVELKIKKATDFKEVVDIMHRWGYAEVVIALKSLENELNEEYKDKNSDKISNNRYTQFTDKLIERQRKFIV